MLTNNNGQELISDNTSESINRNSRPNTIPGTKTLDFRTRISVDSINGGNYNYRTYIGDTWNSGSTAFSTWYSFFSGTFTVEQRQELTSAINTNAALCRKRWTYS